MHFQVSSSPIDPPQVKYGYHIPQEQELTWNWLDVPSPLEGPSNKVVILQKRILNHNLYFIYWYEKSFNFHLPFAPQIRSLLSSHGFSILKIPVNDSSDKLSEGINHLSVLNFLHINIYMIGLLCLLIVVYSCTREKTHL